MPTSEPRIGDRDERLDQELAGLDALELAGQTRHPLGARMWSASWPKLAALAIALGIWQGVVASGWKDPSYVLPGPATRVGRPVGSGVTRHPVDRARAPLPVGRPSGFSLCAGHRCGGRRRGVADPRPPRRLRLVHHRAPDHALDRLVPARRPPVPEVGRARSSSSWCWEPHRRSPTASSPASTTFRRSSSGPAERMGASGLSLFRHVVLPGSLPSFVGGIKQGWAFAWRSLMAGELLVIIANKHSIGERLEHRPGPDRLPHPDRLHARDPHHRHRARRTRVRRRRAGHPAPLGSDRGQAGLTPTPPPRGPSTVEGVTRPEVREARELRDKHRDDRREARRTQLLDDAIEAIRELGPGATMEQLARRGGVTKPILYRHFGDRDGLIGAIAERFSARAARLDPVRARSRATEPRELLERTVDAYLASSSGSRRSTASCSSRPPAATALRPDQPARRHHRPPGGRGHRRAAPDRRAATRAPPCRGPTASSGCPPGRRLVARRPHDDPRARSSATSPSLLWGGLESAASQTLRHPRHVGWGDAPRGAQRRRLPR